MPVRLKDIAADLGVSVVTVSKVLRNHSDIGEETRRRVLERIKELNYQPNLTARALVTGRTYVIGLVVPDLVHPFFAEVAKSLSAALSNHGYSLIIASSDEDPDVEAREIEHLIARRMDALVIASAQTTSTAFTRLEQQKTPYILIDRRFHNLPANFVGVDDEAVGRIATEHLIAVGCRRVAHIRGPQVSTALGRLRGYERALQGHRLGLNPEFIPALTTGDADSDERGRVAMRQLLSLDPRPDGVFCYNDPTAMGAMDAILEAGLSVPDDLAVIGAGNVRYGAFLRVPLSTVDQQSIGIGDQTARLVLKLIQASTHAAPKSILLGPKLIVRASTRRST
ncbi:MAG: LacI family DNA-binding transcriptional regulator [Bryobacteraceae bacterium]